MATASSITDKEYGSTQRDPIDPSMGHYSVTIPSKFYHAMVTVCREKHNGCQCFQNSSNHPISEQKSVSCQTDFKNSGDADQNKPGDNGFGREVASSVAAASNGDSVSKQSDSTSKKTPSGKHYDSNCRIMIPRLTDEMIRALVSPLDRSPKIPCESDMEQKLKASDKRSADPDHEQNKTKQAKSCQSHEMFHVSLRSIESLADSDANVGSMIDHGDPQSSCVDEAPRVLEKCKHRRSGRLLRSQQK